LGLAGPLGPLWLVSFLGLAGVGMVRPASLAEVPARPAGPFVAALTASVDTGQPLLLTFWTPEIVDWA
jgi:hypothetical protein